MRSKNLWALCQILYKIKLQNGSSTQSSVSSIACEIPGIPSDSSTTIGNFYTAYSRDDLEPWSCGMWGTWDFRNSFKTRAEKSVGHNFWIVYEVTGAGPAYSSACCGGRKSKILCSATTQRCSKCGIVIKARHTPSQEIWTVVLQLRESVSLALQVFRCPQRPHQPFAGPQALTADQSPTQPLWCVQRSRSQNHTAVYPSKHLSPSRSHLSPP